MAWSTRYQIDTSAWLESILVPPPLAKIRYNTSLYNKNEPPSTRRVPVGTGYNRRRPAGAD